MSLNSICCGQSLYPRKVSGNIRHNAWGPGVGVGVASSRNGSRTLALASNVVVSNLVNPSPQHHPRT